jgi:hypothetical protein
MVFVMITDIVTEPVKRSIVAIGFLIKSVPQVVLCNKVSCARVQASSEEAAHDEVDQWFEPKVPNQTEIEGKLHGKVEKVPFG